VDMKLGDVLFEAKLTEGNFQIQRAELVQQYLDLKQVFECRRLRGRAGTSPPISFCGTCSPPMLSISISACYSMPVAQIYSNTGIGSSNAYNPQLFAPGARYSRGRSWWLACHRHSASSCT